VICFLDNDILLKLLAFDVMDEALGALRIKPEDLRILDTAQYVFQKSRKVSAKYSEAVRDRAIEFVKTCQTVAPEATDEFCLLSRSLDVGEATLVAATARISPFVLVTGDKRCLQVLATQRELGQVMERLQGRVICLEQVILLLIRRSGFAWVKARVEPLVEYDLALQACFGSGALATEVNVILALEGYIESLRQDSAELLV
jgi:hypothetical protein